MLRGNVARIAGELEALTDLLRDRTHRAVRIRDHRHRAIPARIERRLLGAVPVDCCNTQHIKGQ